MTTSTTLSPTISLKAWQLYNLTLKVKEHSRSWGRGLAASVEPTVSIPCSKLGLVTHAYNPCIWVVDHKFKLISATFEVGS